MRAIFDWLSAVGPGRWLDSDGVARLTGLSRRRAMFALEALVGELAVQRVIRGGACSYRVLDWSVSATLDEPFSQA
jgi:hypothetical protein